LFYTEPAMRLARRLSERSLGGKVFFTNSGAEAIECAIKLARKRRRGGEIVVLSGGFHGRTMGALSATPQEAKQQPFAPLVPGFRVVPRENPVLEEVVSDDTAAVLIEPVQGESGIWPVQRSVLEAARRLYDEEFLAEVTRKGDALREGLVGLALDVRGAGLMLAFQADDGPDFVRRALLEQHLVLNAPAADAVRLLPPLTVSDQEIAEAVER